MATCVTCGKPYTAGAKGWHARITGIGPAGRADAPLARILICPDDFARLPLTDRMAWHEYTGETEGPTREKRPGHLGG